ncbi:hypothetical protein Ahy_B06g082522 [Arachis hypogaea]|uniref:Uncharacterized protein n=1 Tax=Arachis hypogaea TaxID=3818 RepID=A0A444YNJ5_ARAHY|nr:hypothetical protein Ahy_B06g082522 [Arachis hypogaea]
MPLPPPLASHEPPPPPLSSHLLPSSSSLGGKREEFLEQLLSSRNRSRSRSGKKRYSYEECSSSSSDAKKIFPTGFSAILSSAMLYCAFYSSAFEEIEVLRIRQERELVEGDNRRYRKVPEEQDRVLCHFCFKPKKVTNEALSVDHAKKSQVLVSSVILLKTTLDALILLSKVSAVKCGRVQVDGERVSILYIVKSSQKISHFVHRHEPFVMACEVPILQKELDVLTVCKPASVPICHVSKDYFSVQRQLLCCFTTSAYIISVLLDMSFSEIQVLFLLMIIRVMIIDLDAHQGNGHETDFAYDSRVYILDMYNLGIYPLMLMWNKVGISNVAGEVALLAGLAMSLLRGRTMGRWLEDQKERKKQEITTHNAQLHAAVSVAGIAAAVVAIAASIECTL